MGRDSRELKVTATVSRHNSEDDIRDDDLWNLLYSRINELVNDPIFEHISPMIV